jgi:outer membrane immunogenic protein
MVRRARAGQLQLPGLLQLLGTAFLVVLAASRSAFAADAAVPFYKAPVAASSHAAVPFYKAPVTTSSQPFSWTGLYVGAHGGGGWAGTNWFYPSDAVNAVAGPPVGLPLNVSSGGHTAAGWLAGAQIGYNYQIKNWVVGVEAEFSAANLKGSNVDPSFPNINHTQTDFIGTLAGRVGYAWDRVLLFGKAGLGWTHNNYFDSAVATFVSGTAPDAVTLPAGIVENRATLNRFGLMLGAGVEYALTQNWSVKAEYDYLDFGKQRMTFSPVDAGLTPFDEDIKQRIQLVKVGINYKLGSAMPAGAASAGALYDQVGSFYDQIERSARAPRFYGGVDYLLWQVKGAPLSVPLVATGPSSNTDGLLLNSNTTILYGASFAPAAGGNDTQNFKLFSGSRIIAGYWLDDARRLSVEGGGFLLQSQTAGVYIHGSSTDAQGMRIPVYTLPYKPSGMCAPPDPPGSPPVCVVPLGEDGVPVAVPGELSGSVDVKNSLQLWGLEANGVMSFYRTPSLELSAVSGFRYVDLSESFVMTSTIVGAANSAFAGQSGYAIDKFDTRNQFFGGTLGLRGLYNYGLFSLETTARIALGVNHQTLSIFGYYQDFNALLPYSSGPYGIFAMPSNEGISSKNTFAVVPEFQTKLGFDVTPTIRFTVGYDFIYFSNVIRPTDQIDRNIPKGQTYQQDTTQADSSTVPARLFKSTDFWAHGLSVGINARF